jgi:prepilin-type N-terminal cleavage/methylation domain-containing protein
MHRRRGNGFWLNGILIHAHYRVGVYHAALWGSAMRKSNKGFSLLELSVVLVVISMMIGGLLNLATQMAAEAKQNELEMKLATIEEALLNFRKANNRLPCPADGTLSTTNQYFGLEGVTPGDCTTGSSYSANIRTSAAALPTANFYNSTYSNTVGGVVPARTLGLSEGYMMDPWGGRFVYVVDKRLTATNAFNTHPATSTSVGSLTVRTRASAGATLTSSAAVVLLSHGQNGHGAYQISGTRKISGATDSDELKNCHCTATSMTSTAYDSTFVQHPSTESVGAGGYDDTLRFYGRAYFRSSDD